MRMKINYILIKKLSIPILCSRWEKLRKDNNKFIMCLKMFIFMH